MSRRLLCPNVDRTIAFKLPRRPSYSYAEKPIAFKHREGHCILKFLEGYCIQTPGWTSSSYAKRVIAFSNAKRAIAFIWREGHCIQTLRGPLHIRSPRRSSFSYARAHCIFKRWERHWIYLNESTIAFKHQEGHFIFNRQEGHCIFKLWKMSLLLPMPRDQNHLTNKALRTSSYQWIYMILPMDHKCSNIILSVENQHIHHQCSNIILSIKYHHQQYYIIDKVIIMSHHINSSSTVSKLMEADVRIFFLKNVSKRVKHITSLYKF